MPGSGLECYCVFDEDTILSTFFGLLSQRADVCERLLLYFLNVHSPRILSRSSGCLKMVQILKQRPMQVIVFDLPRNNLSDQSMSAFEAGRTSIQRSVSSDVMLCSRAHI